MPRATPVGLARAPTRGYNIIVPNPTTAVVRQWARERGVAVGERGRLSPDLVAAYLAEHGGKASAASPAPARARARSTGAPGSRARTLPSPRAGRVVRAKSPWNWPSLEGAGTRSKGSA